MILKIITCITMYKIQSIEDLKTLIVEATEESTELEFKLNFGMPDDEIITIEH